MNLPSAEDLTGFSRNPLNYFLVEGEKIIQIAAHNHIWHISISLPNIPTSNQSEGRRCSLVAIGLHNYLQQTHNTYYCPSGFIDSENSNGSIKEGFLRDIIRSDSIAGLEKIGNVGSSRYQQNGLEQREALKDYFMNESILSWQLEHVQSCGPVLQH